MSLSDDVILEQTEYTFDAANNVILAVTRERYHNAVASQTGPLNDPSTTPKARVTYVAFYYDGIGRMVAKADYGTNGGVSLTRSDTIPARSDTVLVTTFTYITTRGIWRRSLIPQGASPSFGMMRWGARLSAS